MFLLTTDLRDKLRNVLKTAQISNKSYGEVHELVSGLDNLQPIHLQEHGAPQAGNPPAANAPANRAERRKKAKASKKSKKKSKK